MSRAAATTLSLDASKCRMWDGTRSELCAESRLLARDCAREAFVYYTHFYRAPVMDRDSAMTEYGGPFTAAVERGNLMGVQFHPEKSGDAGLQILENFLEVP